MLTAFALELKDDGSDTLPDEFTAKLAELTKTVNDRIAVVETKSADDAKLTDRLNKLEAKLNRPANDNHANDNENIERKPFTSCLRLGNQTPVEEIKSLTVSSDPQAGYLAPAEMSSEFIRDLVEYSPIRSVASVRTTGAPSVKYPTRT